MQDYKNGFLQHLGKKSCFVSYSSQLKCRLKALLHQRTLKNKGEEEGEESASIVHSPLIQKSYTFHIASPSFFSVVWNLMIHMPEPKYNSFDSCRGGVLNAGVELFTWSQGGGGGVLQLDRWLQRKVRRNMLTLLYIFPTTFINSYCFLACTFFKKGGILSSFTSLQFQWGRLNFTPSDVGATVSVPLDKQRKMCC